MKQTFNKYIFFLIFIINNINSLYSESNNNENILSNLTLEKQYLLPNDIDQLNNLIIKYIDDDIYILKKSTKENTNEDKLFIYKINQQGSNLLNFILPFNDWIYNFNISNNKLYILCQHFIFIYKINTNGCSYIKNIHMENRFEEIKIENNKIILLNSCYSCFDPGIKSIIMDTSGFQLSYHNFNIPIGFQLEFYKPNLHFDYFDNKYLISDIIDYNIILYNIHFDSINTIKRQIEIFDSNKYEKIIFDDRPYNEWAKEKVKLDKIKYINRIEFAEFYNDSTIFICYLDNKKNGLYKNFYYDIWKINKNSNDWYLYKENLKNIQNNNNEKVKLEYIASGLLNTFFINNGKILCIRPVALDLNKLDISNLTYKEFWERNHEYYLNNDLKFSLFIFSIK